MREGGVSKSLLSFIEYDLAITNAHIEYNEVYPVPVLKSDTNAIKERGYSINRRFEKT